MEKTKILTVIIIILAIGNIFFAWMYVSAKVEIRQLETKVKSQEVNAKILNFTQLFMDKILGGGKTVSFDDRLTLENAVRALNDQEIFNSWETFTKANDPAEVQADFYALFRLLLKKITL